MVKNAKIDENELIFGRYNKQIDYRNGQVSQVLEHRTESLLPSSPTNIELVQEILKDMLYEALGGDYKSIGIEVEFKDKHQIKLIKKNFSRKLE